MKSFKKIIASISILAMLIASTIVNAAPLDNATANVTLGENTETLTVNLAGKDFNADSIEYVEIKKNDGTIVYTATEVTANNEDNFTIDFDFDTVLNDTTRYTIAFTTVSKYFSAAVLVINTDNQLEIKATVQPVLKFALEETTKDFGILTTTLTGVTTGIEVGTNAINGVTVTAKSTNGGLKSESASGHTIGLDGNDELYNSEEYTFTSVTGTGDSIALASIEGIASTPIGIVNQTIPVYIAHDPQNFDIDGNYDANFTVSAKIAESTPAASDYTDIIIFTATANF